MNALKNARSLLIINLGGIGDLLLSTASLHALRKALPHARIDLLAVDRGVDFMRTYNLFDHLYPIRDMHSLTAVPELFSLRKNKYDMAINMRTIVSRKSGMMIYLLMKIIGAKTWVGRDTDGYGFFFDVKVPETLFTTVPEYQYDVETMQALGVPVENPANIHIPIIESDRVAVDNLFLTAGILPDEMVIGVNPGGRPSHRWSKDNFIAVLRKIQKTYSCKIVLTGSITERPLCQSIAQEISATDFSGKTETVGQLASVFQRCRLFVSNDTGSLHICVAVGTPGVFIFGPGQFQRYAPFKDKEKHIALYKPEPCAPCEKLCCDIMTCLKSITTEDVYSAMLTILKKDLLVPLGGTNVE